MSKIVDVDSLPLVERWMYWIAGIASIIYGLNSLRLESDRFQASSNSHHLSKGWQWLGRQRDLTDAEWTEWRELVLVLLPICCGRVFLHYICHWLKIGSQVCKLVLIVVDCISLSCLTTGAAVSMIIGQACLMFVVTYTNSILAVWLVGLVMIQSLNFEELSSLKQEYLGMDHDLSLFNMFFTAEAFFYLKVISFGLEKVNYKNHQSVAFDKKNWRNSSQQTGSGDTVHPASAESFESKNTLCNDPTLVDFLYYCISLPMFFDGPIYNFSDFHNQSETHHRSQPPWPNMKDIFWRMLRIAFWAMFIEVQIHFLYQQAIHLSPAFMKTMNLPALLGMGYYQGQFFMVKYLCMYGLAMQWLRFEGIQAHSQPRCITWVYSYADMWKYFDVGLYKFLKMYIFLPVGGWRPRLLNKLLSCCLVFLFVYVFHGTEVALFIWCAGNFLIICIESTACYLEMTVTGRFLKSYLSAAMQLRLRALLALPLHTASCILIFYFFFGGEVGTIFLNGICLEASWTQMLLQGMVYYMNIQNALYIYDKRGCRPTQL